MKKPLELKWICSIILVINVPLLLIGSVLLIELFFANKIFLQLDFALVGLLAVVEAILFIILAIGLLRLKYWAYKVIIPLSLFFLIIFIPIKAIISLVNGTIFDFEVIQNIVISLVLYIWIIAYFRKKEVRNLYLKKKQKD